MGTHPIFESDFDCLTERDKMWTETIPATAIFFAIHWATRQFVLGEEAGRFKGWWAGGTPYSNYIYPWGGNPAGHAKPHIGHKMTFANVVDSTLYGRNVQMALESHQTQWVHPSLMPKCMLYQAQQA